MGKVNAPHHESIQVRHQRERLESGQGSGHGCKYIPFIQVQRGGFQSHGRSHVVYDHRQGRSYHLLSDLELLIFIRLWSTEPVDIREQFPLRLNEFDPEFCEHAGTAGRGTCSIATELGIKHPIIAKDSPRVMTTDFVVNIDGHSKVAVHAKYLTDIVNGTERQQELKKIEEIYWFRRGVRFMVITEQPFDRLMADQLMWAIDGMKWQGNRQELSRFLSILDKTSPTERMSDRLNECTNYTGSSFQDAVRSFKYAVLTRRWQINDMEQELDLSCRWSGRRMKGTTLFSVFYFRDPSK